MKTYPRKGATMTEKTISQRQMADILFQRPGRVTEGILEKRGLWERSRDYWGTWNNADRASYGGLYGAWQEKRRNLFLEFNNMAVMREESPQSMRRAMMELKCAGFSNEQIHEIRHSVIAMAMQYLDHLHGPLKDEQVAYNRDHMMIHTDAAFLSLGRVRKDALNETFNVSGQPDEGRYVTDAIAEKLYEMCASGGNRACGMQPKKLREGLLP